MLKFFRTIRKKLIEQKNVRKYLLYAVGEILLVVTGILIALQVNNWNEERKNSNLEAQYTERIYTDLIETRDRLKVDLVWQRQNVDLGRMVLESLRSCTLNPAQKDDFAKGLFNLGKLNSTLLVNATLEELKTSGRLVIFKNKSLVSDLIRLQQSFHAVSSHIDLMKRWGTQPVNTIQSRIIYLRLHEDTGLSQDIQWEDIELDFNAVCNDSAFKTAVSSLINYTLEMARRDRVLLESTEKLIVKLEHELKNLSINTE